MPQVLAANVVFMGELGVFCHDGIEDGWAQKSADGKAGEAEVFSRRCGRGIGFVSVDGWTGICVFFKLLEFDGSELLQGLLCRDGVVSGSRFRVAG